MSGIHVAVTALVQFEIRIRRRRLGNAELHVLTLRDWDRAGGSTSRNSLPKPARRYFCAISARLHRLRRHDRCL